MEKVNGHQGRLNILEIMQKASKKDMVNSTIQAATSIKEILLKIKGKDMERCFGLMDLFTKEIGRVAFRTEKVTCTWLEVR